MLIPMGQDERTIPASMPATVSHESQDGGAVITLKGDWLLAHAGSLDQQLAQIVRGAAGVPATFLLHDINTIDTAGAWLAARTIHQLEQQGGDIHVDGNPQAHALIKRALLAAREPIFCTAPKQSPLTKIGRATMAIAAEAWQLLVFLGEVVSKLIGSLLRPWRIRWRSVAYHIEHAGIDAVPIVLLLSGLVGLVLAFQGGQELRKFGAEIFTVDLLGISILREMGPLLTAIIVAGRSGSAFAAQIGTMKLNDEIDALKTIGLDPVVMLILPRVIALTLVLPLIAFLANIAALIGGAVVVVAVYGFPLTQVMGQFSQAASAEILLLGLIKTPVFAFIIALVGCRHGVMVSGGAASVGERTTKAVVASIFLVIVVNAVFSIIFARFGL